MEKDGACLMKAYRYRLSALLLAAAAAVWAAMPAAADGLREESAAETSASGQEEAVVTEAQVSAIPAKSAVLLDAGSGQLLFEMNAHE